MMIVGQALVLAGTIAASSLPAPAPPWFGEDKVKHFFASFVITSISASGARAAGIDSTASLAVGASVGAAAGVWKEFRDQRQGGVFSGYDLVWDAAGIAAAGLLQDATR